MFSRFLFQQIKSQLYKGKVIVVYGARRVGKTTVCKEILKSEKNKQTRYLNAELLSVRDTFSQQNEVNIRNFIGDVDLLVIDEAQYIENVGLILKILVDTYPNIQIIATGSSSFDLVNKIGEPLTGRARHFSMFPLAVSEICNDAISAQSMLEKILIYGLYPSVFKTNDYRESISELEEIVSGYLYKDILAFESLKHADKIVTLLQLLAFQVGSEVSYIELGKSLRMDRATVEKYVDLLEKCFVIFRLKSFSRNIRKELTKSCKIYFYDLGIRNSLIRNYNPLTLRNDIGALWENFVLSERLKRNNYHQFYGSSYFWRTQQQQEIDYIEEIDGVLHAYEFKWNPNKQVRLTDTFARNYPNHTFTVIDPDNYQTFV